MKGILIFVTAALLRATALQAGPDKLILDINVFQGHRSNFPLREAAPPTMVVLPPDPGWSNDIERQRQQIADTLGFDGVAIVAKNRAEVNEGATHKFDVGTDWRFPYQISVRAERVGGTRIELDIRIMQEERTPAGALSIASIQGELGKTFTLAQNTPGNPVLVAVTPRLLTGAMTGGEIKTVGDGVTQPKLIRPVDPTYPERVRKEKVTGQVVVQAVIEKDGTVARASIVRPVHPDLDAATLEAVRQWRYEPARQNGKPVAVYMTITVDFRLK
jgi:TonB family protein